MKRILMLVSLGVLWCAVATAQHAPSCEQQRAVSVKQATLLHQDYMVTQGKLAEALVAIEQRDAEIVRLKEAAAKAVEPPKAEPPAAPLPEKEPAQ